VTDIIVDMASDVSAHSLVIATLAVSGVRAACPPTPHAFRPLKHIEVVDFDHRLRAYELFMLSAATVDEFLAQI